MKYICEKILFLENDKKIYSVRKEDSETLEDFADVDIERLYTEGHYIENFIVEKKLMPNTEMFEIMNHLRNVIYMRIQDLKKQPRENMEDIATIEVVFVQTKDAFVIDVCISGEYHNGSLFSVICYNNREENHIHIIKAIGFGENKKYVGQTMPRILMDEPGESDGYIEENLHSTIVNYQDHKKYPEKYELLRTFTDDTALFFIKETKKAFGKYNIELEGSAHQNGGSAQINIKMKTVSLNIDAFNILIHETDKEIMIYAKAFSKLKKNSNGMELICREYKKHFGKKNMTDLMIFYYTVIYQMIMDYFGLVGMTYDDIKNNLSDIDAYIDSIKNDYELNMWLPKDDASAKEDSLVCIRLYMSKKNKKVYVLMDSTGKTEKISEDILNVLLSNNVLIKNLDIKTRLMVCCGLEEKISMLWNSVLKYSDDIKEITGSKIYFDQDREKFDINCGCLYYGDKKELRFCGDINDAVPSIKYNGTNLCKDNYYEKIPNAVFENQEAVDSFVWQLLQRLKNEE